MVSSSAKSPPAANAPPRTRAQKWLRRGLLALAGIFVLFIAVFLLIPVWMSNEQGRIYVLDRINRSLHGPRVAIDKWSLGWFQDTRITNLRIYQPDGTLLFSCPDVASGLSLWGLFRGDYDIGNTTADKAQMRIVKFTDGTTSLDSFIQQAGDVLHSARGALQITSAQLDVESQKAAQTLSFSDLKATITIASPEAPFHVEISASNPRGADISLKAAFPPIRTLAAAADRHDYWPLLSDLDFSADRFPTAMLCDFLSLDPAWADSFGDFFGSLQLSAHPAAQSGATAVTLLARSQGTWPFTSAPYIDARVLLDASDASPAAPTLSIAGSDFHADAALRISPPLCRLLGRLNPIFSESSADPAARENLAALQTRALNLPLYDLSKTTAAARLTFPAMRFTARDGPSIVRQLQVVSGIIPRVSPGNPNHIPGTPGPMRVDLADGQFSYDNFLVTLGSSRINFSGSVNLSGALNLSADIPTASSGLSAGQSQVLISGNIDSPLVNHAE